MNTMSKRLIIQIVLLAMAMVSAIGIQAQQLREGHFFKTFGDGQPTAKAAPEVFGQWFALPELS